MKIDDTSLVTEPSSDLDVLASMLQRAGTRFRVVATSSVPDDVEPADFEPGAPDGIFLILENRARVEEEVHAVFDLAGALVELRIVHGPREFPSSPPVSARREGGR